MSVSTTTRASICEHLSVRRDEQFTVEQHVVVDVELPSGSILVRSGVVGTVTVSIESSAPDFVDIGQLGDNISVRAGRRSRSARIVVDAPTGSDVNVKGASVEVATRGALGALRVRSASGDIAAEGLVRAEVSLASGDARFELVRNDASFNSTSGDVVVRSIGGRLAATLTSGDLHIGDLAGDVEVQSASGDVTIRRCDGASLNIRTLSGDIRVGLPAGIRVDPEISTMSGRVSLPEPAESRPDATAERRPVKVRLRTVSGDIRIERVS
jgi:hypothetical protein